MITFKLSLEALGHTRFGYSPLGELAASLRGLTNGRVDAVFSPWRREVGPALERLDLSLLKAIAPRGYSSPDFLYVWSTDAGVTIDDQLAELMTMPGEAVATQLREAWAGEPPGVLEGLLNGDGRDKLCNDLAAYWHAAIRPYWARIRSTIDDDIAARAHRLLAEGLYGLLEGLHPEISVRDDILAVDKPQHPDAHFDAPTITLIPSVFVWPQLLVAKSAEQSFELQYPARAVGRVWAGGLGNRDEHEAIAALVGRGRAAIMHNVASPRSTTQLAQALGASPASVNAHLTVLRRAGLVSATRSGRSVFYQRTPLAASILAAAPPGR